LTGGNVPTNAYLGTRNLNFILKMKKYTLLLLTALAVIGFTACNKLEIDKDTPDCISFKIKDFNETGSCDSAKVDLYTFLQEDAYLFDPGACTPDTTSAIFNFDCVKLGELGGYKNNTLISGKQWSGAVFVKTIWTKE
jgi:hypothetical protein